MFVYLLLYCRQRRNVYNVNNIYLARDQGTLSRSAISSGRLGFELTIHFLRGVALNDEGGQLGSRHTATFAKLSHAFSR